jgi:alpha-mannosidase
MAKERAAIHLVPHFHYDPVWIEDQRTYTRQAFDLIGQYLESCQQDEAYHVLLYELDYLRPFLASFGDERQALKELLAMGRVGIGGSYSQPNEMTLQGEPLIRNLLYGRLYCREVLGATPRVYLPLDVFGHCVQLPQLAAKAGFEAIVWSKDIVGAPPICRAIAPDGTSLLQKHEHYWYYPETLEEFLDTVADGLENQAALGLSQDLRFLGYDMGAARPWLAHRSSELAEMDPAVRLSTPDKYLATVGPEIRARRATLPISGRDFSWYHAGTLVTRADLKIANRTAENRVLSAEKWATLAGLLGAVYPDAALDKAWRQVLFGQHHDAVTGVSSDIPFLDLLAGYRDVLELAGEVEDKALAYIAGRADTAAGRRAPRDGTALVVFNSLSWARTDVCRARIPLEGELAEGFRMAADDGRRVRCQITERSTDDEHPWVDVVFIAPEVSSLGYRTFYVAPDRRMPEEASSSEAAEATIENEFLRVTADANMGGGLSSIYSKRLRREFVDLERAPAGDLVVLSEKVDREMAPWELWTTGETSRCSEQPARVEVLTGPVFSQLRVTATMAERCTVVREFTLYQGLDRLELRTILDQYSGEHELVALTFPFDVPAASPIFEDRFAVVVRRRSQGRLDFRTHEGQNASRCGLGAAQNWIDVGPGPSLTVMSGRRPVGAVPLSPCVIVTSEDLRARAAARVLLQALQSRGVTCTHRLDSEDPEGDPAACAFTISLGRDNEYSAKLLERFSQAASRLAELNGKLPWGGVLLHRADPSEEWPGVPVLVADTNDEGGVARLAELLAEAVRADELRLPESQDFSGLAQPAPQSGVALVNRGTLAASLESDGTLVAPLFHTSSWSTHSWGEGRLSRFFVPEHKSHVFEHTLHPHSGDWREGGLVQVGHETNNPLRVSQVKVGTGVLPTSFSLVSIDSPNVVLAALKPLGNPLAEHKVTKNSHPQNGVLLRLYESHGQPVEAALRFPTTVEEAWLTDLTEEKTGELEAPTGGWRRQAEIRVPAGACELISLAARLGPLAESGPAQQLGPTSEPQAPLHSRYWDHNAGAAPLGNQPVTLSMRGPVPIGETTRFTVGVTNDALDREIAGSVTMIAPEEWTMIPRQLPYRIPPDSPTVYEVMVVVPPEARPCFIRAVAEEGEQMVQDVLPVGDIAPLEVSLQRGEDGFLVSLRNPNEDYVEGEVTLVTPVESWGRLVDTLALSNVAPRSHVFRIDGGQEQSFAFAVSGKAEGLWAVAKVAWYGNVQYVQESEPV